MGRAGATGCGRGGDQRRRLHLQLCSRVAEGQQHAITAATAAAAAAAGAVGSQLRLLVPSAGTRELPQHRRGLQQVCERTHACDIVTCGGVQRVASTPLGDIVNGRGQGSERRARRRNTRGTRDAHGCELAATAAVARCHIARLLQLGGVDAAGLSHGAAGGERVLQPCQHHSQRYLARCARQQCSEHRRERDAGVAPPAALIKFDRNLVRDIVE